MIDHDRLFKELLTTFFGEFLDLFLPEIAGTLDRDSIRSLPQEYFADLTSGEDKIIDLLVEVKQFGENVGFLVQVEAQSYKQSDFTQRMFF
jgi:predicted transposase/invertase (TIGR01784 family)